jgi:hypothetical protein
MADVHGDYDGVIRILTKANLIDENTNWIGNDTILIQTGDVMDKGDQVGDVLELFAKLKRQSNTVIMLMGNHELMNLLGVFSHEKYRPFVRTFNTSAIIPVGSQRILFSHAGFTKEFIPYMNDWVHEDHVLLWKNGPFWNRFFSLEPNETKVCEELQQTLDLTHTTRMVIGHTVFPGVHTRCNGQLVLADVGFSRYYRGHPLVIEWLEDGWYEIIDLEPSVVVLF